MHWQAYVKYPVVFGVAFAMTWLLTPLLMRLAPRLGMQDQPGERRLHRATVPRCGGLAVFAGFHAACATVYWVPWLPFVGQLQAGWWWRFAAVSGFLLAVGIVDDIRGLRPWVKLAGQVAAAALAFGLGMRVEGLLQTSLPLWMDFPLTVLWFLVFINAFNLIDGLDGLASGLGAIASLGLAGSLLLRHSPGDVLVLLGLTGSCLAFLRYNFHPARVFLGDAGSMFLGLTLAAVSLSTGSKGAVMASIGVPLLAAGIPLLDTALAIWRRTMRRLAAGEGENGGGDGARIFVADMDHVHHRMVRSGLSQKAAATWLYAVAGLMAAVGLVTMVWRSRAMGIAMVAFVAGVYAAVRHLAHVEIRASGEAIMRGLRRPPGRVLGVVLYPLLDALVLGLALALALALLDVGLAPGARRTRWVELAPWWVGLPFLALLLGGAYRRVWSRARISEYVALVLALIGGFALTGGIRAVVSPWSARDHAVQAFLAGGMAVLFIAGIRAFPRAVQDAMAWLHRRHVASGDGARRALVYGAGYRCTLFLRARSFEPLHEQHDRQIVGLLDDDRNLHDRLVFGHRVLGGIEEAERVLREQRIVEVIITADLAADVREQLMSLVRTMSVALLEWEATARVLYDPEASGNTDDGPLTGPAGTKAGA